MVKTNKYDKLKKTLIANIKSLKFKMICRTPQLMMMI